MLSPFGSWNSNMTFLISRGRRTSSPPTPTLMYGLPSGARTAVVPSALNSVTVGLRLSSTSQSGAGTGVVPVFAICTTWETCPVREQWPARCRLTAGRSKGCDPFQGQRRRHRRASGSRGPRGSLRAHRSGNKPRAPVRARHPRIPVIVE